MADAGTPGGGGVIETLSAGRRDRSTSPGWGTPAQARAAVRGPVPCRSGNDQVARAGRHLGDPPGPGRRRILAAGSVNTVVGRSGRAEDEQLPGVPRVSARRPGDAARWHRPGGGVSPWRLAARAAARPDHQARRARSRDRLHFDQITQPWLRGLVKRLSRLRLSSGLAVGTVVSNVKALRRFSAFLVDAATRWTPSPA